jgi:D-threo-aldose 1-dehydrogenase
MNTTLRSVPLGRTHLHVSEIGFGSAPVAGLYRSIPEEDAVATIRHALDSGITLFDTAPLYSVGRAERLVGKALAGVPRDGFVLSTKIGRILDTEYVDNPPRDNNAERPWHFDFSPDGVLRSLESSLERLQMDRVDILHIHDPDNHQQEAIEQAFPTLADLRSQGVITAVSAGMNQWQALQYFAENGDFDCFLLAGRYTLLEQTSLDFLETCRKRNIGIFLGGVFNSGILATGPVAGARHNYREPAPEIMERVERIQAICARHRDAEGAPVPLHAAAIQFAAAHPAVTSLVLGAASQEEIDANLAALRRPIPAAFWEELRAEGILDPAAPLPVSQT